MALREPVSSEECVYITNRYLGEHGSLMCWVFREKCTVCGKSLMGKPRDDKGKVKIRAKKYVCPSCAYTVEKQTYEDRLTANVKYTCPDCAHSGELQVPFKRKKIQGTPSLVFSCQKCKNLIYITKKMKELGEKGGFSDEDGEDTA